MITKRDVWGEAKRRLIERYLRDRSGTSRITATNIVSEQHVEIGAVMDEIERVERTGA